MYNHSTCGRCRTPITMWDIAGRTAYACQTCTALCLLSTCLMGALLRKTSIAVAFANGSCFFVFFGHDTRCTPPPSLSTSPQLYLPAASSLPPISPTFSSSPFPLVKFSVPPLPKGLSRSRQRMLKLKCCSTAARNSRDERVPHALPALFCSSPT